VDASGYVYITGSTSDDLFTTSAGGNDAFLAKYDLAGNFVWARQVGTPENENSNSVTSDDFGNIYISGRTSGAFGGVHVGDHDAFIMKFDASGNSLWCQQLGSSEADQSWGVSADKLGVYFTGWTDSDFAHPSAGGLDAFLVKISDVPEPSAALLALLGLAAVTANRNLSKKLRATC
jgi:hypothetical protein